MARGLDFKNVDIIINYDSPPYAQTYVHRVGRTARAGASGEAFTLIRKDQAFHFRRMTKKIEGSNAVSLKLGSDWDSFALAESHRYENCLAQVQETLHSEEQSRKQRARRPR